MFRKITSLLIVSMFLSLGGYAQNFNRTMSSQKAAIRAAYKKGRVTQKEYNKLMDEQRVIATTIEKYNADRYLSPDEKNKIAGKQQRAANRIRKYQNNNERY